VPVTVIGSNVDRDAIQRKSTPANLHEQPTVESKYQSESFTQKVEMTRNRAGCPCRFRGAGEGGEFSGRWIVMCNYVKVSM